MLALQGTQERSGAWSPRQPWSSARAAHSTAQRPGPACQQPQLLTHTTALQFPPSSPCQSFQNDRDAQQEQGTVGDQLIPPWQEKLILQISLSLSHSSVSLGERAAKGSSKFNHTVLLKGQYKIEMMKSSAFLPSTLHQMHT